MSTNNGRWYGGHIANVACARCDAHFTARQRKDGTWFLPAHKHHVMNGKRLTTVPCQNPPVSVATLRTAYADALKREVLRKENSIHSWKGWRAAELTRALATEFNDTPGLDDGEVLFELFRDVIGFLLSDVLWRHVAVQAEEQMPVLSWYFIGRARDRKWATLGPWELRAREGNGAAEWQLAFNGKIHFGERTSGDLNTAMDCAERTLREQGVVFRSGAR